MKGIFITIEGMDGSGKTTQINRLKEYFETKGKHVRITREPGGTRISEAIREIILNVNYQEMDYVTEALLYAAARAQHVAEYILPAVEQGDIVICDRFVDSSIVYQGMARELGQEMVATINQYATKGLQPDITFFLDLEHRQGMERKKNQQELDRLEGEKEQFHQKVRDGYKQLAKANQERMIDIDASQSIEEVHQCILLGLKEKGIITDKYNDEE
ncbi:dTMP kinase [Vallitaleaceae bacterium 9-2]